MEPATQLKENVCVMMDMKEASVTYVSLCSHTCSLALHNSFTFPESEITTEVMNPTTNNIITDTTRDNTDKTEVMNPTIDNIITDTARDNTDITEDNTDTTKDNTDTSRVQQSGLPTYDLILIIYGCIVICLLIASLIILAIILILHRNTNKKMMKVSDISMTENKGQSESV